MDNSEKWATIADLSKKLDKELGSQTFHKYDDKVGQQIPCISTGLPSLDWEVFGCGGVPKGRIIEIYGEESSGKTALCSHIIGQCQKEGGIAAFIDAEHAFEPSYAATMGIDMSKLLISQPDFGEQALEIVIALVESKAVDLIVIDSVSALVPRAELEGEMGDSVTFETPVYIRKRGSSLVEIKQIGDLYRKNQTGWYKKFKSVEILTHKGWQPLLGVQKKKNVQNKRIRYTRTTSGYVSTTEDHSLFVNGKEKSPRELKVWDRLDTVPLPTFGVSSICPIELSWLLGFYVAEGSTPRTKNYLHFEVCNTEKALIDRCHSVIKSLFGLDGDIRVQKNEAPRRDLYVLAVEANSVLGFFMQECLTDSLNKQVPTCVLNGTLETKKAFLDGFWHGDGNHSSEGARKFFNNSLVAIAGLQTMLPQSTIVIKSSNPNQVTLTEGVATSHPAEIRQFYDGEIPEFLYDISTKAGTFVTLGGIVCHNSHMGLMARMMSQCMRKLVGITAKSSTTIIFINQVRDKIGLVFGNPETTSGGKALRFAATARIRVSREAQSKGGQIKDGEVVIGHKMRVKAQKNKAGAPYKETTIDLLYASGFDMIDDLINHAQKIGIVEGNAWLTVKGGQEKYRRDELPIDKIKSLMTEYYSRLFKEKE
jgi:RecA/RadA recombinase/DNA-binding transcriptional regulator WhiA